MYRRHCDQDSIPKKKQMDLCSFQSSIAKALLLANKEKHSPKRGRPSTNSSDEVSRKKRHVVANPMPVVDVRYDRLGHFPVFTDKQKRCRFCPNGYSRVKCCKCEIQFFSFSLFIYHHKNNIVLYQWLLQINIKGCDEREP